MIPKEDPFSAAEISIFKAVKQEIRRRVDNCCIDSSAFTFADDGKILVFGSQLTQLIYNELQKLHYSKKLAQLVQYGPLDIWTNRPFSHHKSLNSEIYSHPFYMDYRINFVLQLANSTFTVGEGEIPPWASDLVHAQVYYDYLEDCLHISPEQLDLIGNKEIKLKDTYYEYPAGTNESRFQKRYLQKWVERGWSFHVE